MKNFCGNRLWALALILSVSCLLSGCAGKLTGSAKADEAALVIPDFPAAQEQFQFAKAYQGSLLISPEISRRKVQMAKVSQCYERLLKNFPNDRTYVPLSYLELGDCAAQSDDMDRAIQYYRQAQSLSQDEFVQARAEYSIGRILNIQGKYEEAKSVFKGIMDRFGKTESGKVKDVVNRSAQLYLKVVDPSEAKEKKGPQQPSSPALNFR